MFLHRNVVMIVACVLSCVAAPLSAQDEKAEAHPLAQNAALMYWLAFDQLDVTMADERFSGTIGSYEQADLSPQTVNLVQKHLSLDLLHEGAAMERCDWGTSLLLRKHGPGLLLPHISKSRNLARLALLRARWHMAEGRGDKAVDDLVAVYRLGRHTEQEGILISMLVGHAINGIAKQFVATHFAELGDDDLKRLREALGKAPAHTPMKVAMNAEREGMVEWLKVMVEDLADPNKAGQFAEALGPQGAAFRAMGKEALLGMIKDLDKHYVELIPMFELRRDEFKKATGEWEERVLKSANPLVKLLMPALAAVYDVNERTRTQDLILQAAIALRLEGQAKFEAIKDPYGDGPFELEKGDEAMTIKSKLEVRKEAVMLKFVTKKK